MDKIANPHDAYFKKVMSEKENARSFLENYLPQDVLSLMALDKLEIEKDSFITPELKEYFSDLLYKVKIAGKPGYVYVLFEHKSYSEEWISLQLLEYMLQCWKLKKEQKQKLPVIIPIVVHHGTEKWKPGFQLSDLLESKDERVARYIPDFEYILQDLSRCKEEELVGIASLKAMLYLLKYIHSEELVKKLEIVFRMVAREINQEILIAITVYLLNTTKIQAKTLKEIATKAISEKGGEIIMTTAEQLIQQGKIEGEIKGKIEGKIEATLEIKFGAKGLAFMEKLRNIQNMDKLTQILALARKAQTISELESDCSLL